MLEALWDVKKQKPSKIGFVGFGISGKGVYEALKEEIKGLDVTVRSKKTENVPNGVLGIFGDGYLSNINEDIIIVSPGIRWDTKELIEAQRNGTVLSSDANLFFLHNRLPVIGITGSDGKSTTVSLTNHLLTYGNTFSKVVSIGNIGKSFCKELLSIKERGAFVAEVSSFQLMNLKPKTKRSVITNLTRNHEDWHKTSFEYKSAKMNVYQNCEEPIGNADLPEIMPTGACFSAFSSEKSAKELFTICDVCYTVSEDFILRNGEKYIPKSAVLLPGEHGLKNTLCALALTDGMISKEQTLSALSVFKPLPHRAETVGEIEGVRFVDSSIDSTPSRTSITLSAYRASVILLLGGRSKNVPLEPLLNSVKNHAKGVIAFGEMAETLESFFLAHKSIFSKDFFFGRVYKMEEAVKLAFSLSSRGDTVLLSPSGTSFDEFENYEKRGDAFCKAVHLLQR